jgi:hypothetical protein
MTVGHMGIMPIAITLTQRLISSRLLTLLFRGFAGRCEGLSDNW